jgi:hypothetical protein
MDFTINENVEKGDIDNLWNKIKSDPTVSIYIDPYEDEAAYKFDFAFALTAFSANWSKDMDYIYQLGCALTLEWEFKPNMAWYDPENEPMQKDIYDLLEEIFEVKTANK